MRIPDNVRQSFLSEISSDKGQSKPLLSPEERMAFLGKDTQQTQPITSPEVQSQQDNLGGLQPVGASSDITPTAQEAPLSTIGEVPNSVLNAPIEPAPSFPEAAVSVGKSIGSLIVDHPVESLLTLATFTPAGTVARLGGTALKFAPRALKAFESALSSKPLETVSKLVESLKDTQSLTKFAARNGAAFGLAKSVDESLAKGEVIPASTIAGNVALSTAGAAVGVAGASVAPIIGRKIDSATGGRISDFIKSTLPDVQNALDKVFGSPERTAEAIRKAEDALTKVSSAEGTVVQGIRPEILQANRRFGTELTVPELGGITASKGATPFESRLGETAVSINLPSIAAKAAGESPLNSQLVIRNAQNDQKILDVARRKTASKTGVRPQVLDKGTNRFSSPTISKGVSNKVQSIREDLTSLDTHIADIGRKVIVDSNPVKLKILSEIHSKASDIGSGADAVIAKVDSLFGGKSKMSVSAIETAISDIEKELTKQAGKGFSRIEGILGNMRGALRAEEVKISNILQDAQGVSLATKEGQNFDIFKQAELNNVDDVNALLHTRAQRDSAIQNKKFLEESPIAKAFMEGEGSISKFIDNLVTSKAGSFKSEEVIKEATRLSGLTGEDVFGKISNNISEKIYRIAFKGGKINDDGLNKLVNGNIDELGTIIGKDLTEIIKDAKIIRDATIQADKNTPLVLDASVASRTGFTNSVKLFLNGFPSLFGAKAGSRIDKRVLDKLTGAKSLKKIKEIGRLDINDPEAYSQYLQLARFVGADAADTDTFKLMLALPLGTLVNFFGSVNTNNGGKNANNR